MARKHLKRLAAPSSWGILPKAEVFITRPAPGKHTLSHCLPLVELLKQLKAVSTSREAKCALRKSAILIDGIQARSPKMQVGLMDEITISGTTYRMLIDSRGHLMPIPSPKQEQGVKPCKITSKTMEKGGRLSLHTSDGRTIISDKKTTAGIGDTIMLTIPQQKISGHHKLEPGAFVYLTGGKHLGDRGVVSSIAHHNLAYHGSDGQQYTTLKKYAFVLGKGTSSIALP